MLSTILLLAPAPQTDALDLDALRALVLPDAAESTWESIPWRASLWEGRVAAAREGKPILLWEMDGNPLGCT
jgi:hypothetical protein